MRDPGRLYKLYGELMEEHMKVPDLRFGQLMMNFMNWFYEKYKTDIFYIEDYSIVGCFEEFIKEIKGE